MVNNEGRRGSLLPNRARCPQNMPPLQSTMSGARSSWVFYPVLCLWNDFLARHGKAFFHHLVDTDTPSVPTLSISIIAHIEGTRAFGSQSTLDERLTGAE